MPAPVTFELDRFIFVRKWLLLTLENHPPMQPQAFGIPERAVGHG